MSYQSLIQHLFAVNLFSGIKLGLHNCQSLQKLLDYPDRNYPIIHVAGTNGKGSVTKKIASALEAEGYRVGLYTSPHISCFRERIQINGQMISEQSVQDILSKLFKITDDNHISATFFEFTTFLALLYFAQEKVDAAVLETGLGGRLDATNIVHPILSVITSISLDHTDILGKTIAEITEEKAGIIKPEIPVIIGPKVSFPLIKKKADPLNSPCFQVEEIFTLFEDENRAIAAEALKHLRSQFHLSDQSIQEGLNSRQPCRFEAHDTPCPLILDVAHNPDGLAHLFQAIDQQFEKPSIRLLFGLSKNKDIDQCLQILQTHAQDFHIVEAPNGRGLPVHDLRALLLKHGIDPLHIHIVGTIAASLAHAVKKTNEFSQVLVICGSFFIMSEVRKALGFDEPYDEWDMNERSSERV